MAFKVFDPGVLTSSDVNTFLMRQAVITCTSSTRPASPSEGMTIYETDTDRYKTYSGSAWEDGLKSGAWVSYTPTLVNAGAGTDWSLGNGTAVGAYQKVGRLVVGYASIVFGSTTVFGTKALWVSAPVAIAARSAQSVPMGVCIAEDTSVPAAWQGKVLQNASGGLNLRPLVGVVSGIYLSSENITSTVPFTWVSGDELNLMFSYEAAA